MKTVEIKEKKDTYSYKGLLNSDFWLKRAMGVYIYSVLGGLIVACVLFIVWLLSSFLLRVMGF